LGRNLSHEVVTITDRTPPNSGATKQELRYLVYDSSGCTVHIPVGATSLVSAARRRFAAFPSFLNRRTRDIAIRAVDATVARLRAKQGAAAGALVEELAGVSRHRLRRVVPAVRTSQDRSQLHRALRIILIRAGSKWLPAAAAAMRTVARLRSANAAGDRRGATHDPSGPQAACRRRA
jgi:hypothetical protein